MMLLGAEILLSKLMEYHLSFKSQNWFYRLPFYQIFSQIYFHQNPPLTNFWQQCTLPSLPFTFCHAWSCCPQWEAMPCVACRKISLQGQNEQLVGVSQIVQTVPNSANGSPITGWQNKDVRIMNVLFISQLYPFQNKKEEQSWAQTFRQQWWLSLQLCLMLPVYTHCCSSPKSRRCRKILFPLN